MENQENKSTNSNILLSWEAPEFINHQKGRTWLISAVSIVLFLVIYAIMTNSATMAIVFVVLTGVYYLTHNQEPKIIEIKITELGIHVDQKFYPYHMINSYWVVYEPPYVQTLNLRLGKKTVSKLTIQLDRQSPVAIRKILSKEIPEIEGQDETFADILIRLLRL